MPSTLSFSVSADLAESWRLKALSLGDSFPYFCLLENRSEPGAHSWLKPGEWMAGMGLKQQITGEAGFFDRLSGAQYELPLFGFLGYDLKNQVEKLVSRHADSIGAGDAFLFEPLHFLHFDGENLRIQSHEDPEQLMRLFEGTVPLEGASGVCVELKPAIGKEAYLEKVRQTKAYIRDGEVYELNLCVEHFHDKAHIDPAPLYKALSDTACAPFSAFLKMKERHVLCASPERFLKKTGRHIFSQPIKGTRGRGKDPLEDEALRNELQHSEKDRAENVMIVDLVRNDLARSCVPGSVKVDELFGIYSFRNVHQMISTVSGTLREEVSGIEALRNAFPMGSMTGAPKIRAMQLIEELEESRRGIYSGALGVFFPNGDFDLNVVIRSILYNSDRQYLSVYAGGAITIDSEPEEELSEIQVKLSAIHQLLGA